VKTDTLQIIESARAQDCAETEAFGDVGGRIITVRLNSAMRDRFNDLARSYGVSTNTLIRRLMLAEIQSADVAT
jgi:DNA-binding HxlR family transcriptional regulator